MNWSLGTEWTLPGAERPVLDLVLDLALDLAPLVVVLVVAPAPRVASLPVMPKGFLVKSSAGGWFATTSTHAGLFFNSPARRYAAVRCNTAVAWFCTFIVVGTWCSVCGVVEVVMVMLVWRK